MKPAKPTAVVLDIDGVIADFNTPFVVEVCKEAGIDPKTVELKQWHWYRDYAISQEQVSKVYDRIIVDNPAWWLGLQILPGSQALINDCLNLKLDIHFVTARPPSLYGYTSDWLSQFIHQPRLCMTERKGLYCAAVEAKYFLDDKPENCQNVLHMRGTETYSMLRAQPWNTKTSHPYIRRVESLEEVSEIIRREQR